MGESSGNRRGRAIALGGVVVVLRERTLLRRAEVSEANMTQAESRKICYRCRKETEYERKDKGQSERKKEVSLTLLDSTARRRGR